jgi:hypothetical protein
MAKAKEKRFRIEYRLNERGIENRKQSYPEFYSEENEKRLDRNPWRLYEKYLKKGDRDKEFKARSEASFEFEFRSVDLPEPLIEFEEESEYNAS